ncbi:MAG: molybdopterin-guanine dinucleotide biosynthesis protein B [Deltaproteobacteria bacterium]|nr:molybdopterin-guanine dinucleotide biosynthesis protein B [Deltaproteobacteria bacterium]
MKAIGIIGYHKSGKTTLGLKLCREFSDRGLRVGVIKHVSCELRLADADSSRYRPFASVIGAASPSEAEIIFRAQKSLRDMLLYCTDCDIVLVEGFKKERIFPKIVCLREKEEKEELLDGLELFTASFREGIADYLISGKTHISEMADVALEKAFVIE